MAIPCVACAKPMSEDAVVCPHCGARQPDRDPLPDRRKPAGEGDGGRPLADDGAAPPTRAPPAPLEGLSPEELAALVSVDSPRASGVDRQSAIARLWLLHPRSNGLARVIEGVCIVVGSPLYLAGTLQLSAASRLRRQTRMGLGDQVTTGPAAELMGVVAALGPGGAALYTALDLLDVASPGAWVALPCAAVLLRAGTRAWRAWRDT